MKSKDGFIKFLHWLEKYSKTDMLYLAKSSFWLVSGRIITTIISFGTLYAFGLWLPKETFGRYQYILSVITIIGITTLPQMGQALTRAIAKGKEGMLAICAKTKMKWSLIGFAGCLSVSFWYLYNGNSTLGISFLMGSFFFPWPRIFNEFTSFWQGKKKFDIQNKQLIYINILEAATFIPVVFLTDNLIVIMFAYFITRSLFRGMAFLKALKKTTNQETDDKTLSFGKHLTLMQGFGTIASNLDKIIIWQFLGPIAVATFSFAQIPVQKTQTLDPLAALALPKLSEKKIKEIKKGLLVKFFKFFLFSIPFALLFVILIPWGYKLFFPKYMEAIPYARALALSLVLIPFSLLSISLKADMKTKQLYRIKIIAPVIKIVLLFVLIPLFGIWGIVASFLAEKTIESLLTLYFFNKI